MAVPDHTVLACLSDLPDYLFAHLRRAPPDSMEAEERSSSDIDPIIACIDQVKVVITGLLGDSDAFREATHEGLDVWPTQWPLTSISYGSLLVAAHLLDQYAERLMQARNE